ncbi:hypothetical protein OUZ56_022393 [Daphnia magna]|uniref:Uncharacterized protein n=1 Tax=Daphnia magna TaxID=35525 RepID=A0ABR0AW98_9CRUS|nr:hypothetical protein OUZ56_022393 [Daphnia magna]
MKMRPLTCWKTSEEFISLSFALSCGNVPRRSNGFALLFALRRTRDGIQQNRIQNDDDDDEENDDVHLLGVYTTTKKSLGVATEQRTRHFVADEAVTRSVNLLMRERVSRVTLESSYMFIFLENSRVIARESATWANVPRCPRKKTEKPAKIPT